MGTEAVPPGLWERIRSMIREEVGKLLKSGMLRNASISGGGLTIKGGSLRVLYPASEGGRLGVFFGDLTNSVTGDYLGTGLLVQAPDGGDIAQFRSDVATGENSVVIFDASQATAFSTDNIGGLGLARPYLSNGFVPARYGDWTVNTTSSTFETLFTSTGYRTHAGIMAWTRSSMDTSGTTGEIRVLVNGAPLEAPAAIGWAQTLTYHGPTVLPGSAYDLLTVEIQGRVSGGAGALRVAGGGWLGRPA